MDSTDVNSKQDIAFFFAEKLRDAANKFPAEGVHTWYWCGRICADAMEEVTRDQLFTGLMGFRKALEKLINWYSMENNSDTPDYILAEYLEQCLVAFDMATRKRDVCMKGASIG